MAPATDRVEQLALVIAEALGSRSQGEAELAPGPVADAAWMIAAAVLVDRVEGPVGQLDDVEGVEADDRLGDLATSRVPVHGAEVHGHGLDAFPALVAQGLVEGLQGGAPLALGYPHHPPT